MLIKNNDGFIIDILDFKERKQVYPYVHKYDNNSSILTISYENKNPYFEKKMKGYQIYHDEWLVRYIANEEYLKCNNIVHSKDNSTIENNGLILENYYLHIDDDKNIEYPYYNISIIKTKESIIDFYLIVMKSKNNQNETFDKLLTSFKLEKLIKTEFKYEQKKLVLPSWNEETKKYYEKLVNQDSIDWGIFRKCLLSKKDGDYDNREKWINENNNYYDNLMDHNFELYPTYMHISWNGILNYFPLEMAKKYCGGNGFNNKKILHFTMQFTTDNNSSNVSYSPTFDILRGKYDEYFRTLARDIKAYKHPVLFRLNNEMNTDWTSYSGIMSLLDPDIFIFNYSRLFNIFKEEGVDNCIWIFNPIAISTPYSNWGEFINYFPDEMVHLSGLTYYERGNIDNKYEDFNSMYTYLLNFYNLYLKDYKKIISEFGSGAGGSVVYNYEEGKWMHLVEGRNNDKQAKWIENMFNDFNNNSLFKDIKAAVWFSVNDYAYVDNKNQIMNYFSLDYNKSIESFKNGLKKK